MLLQFMHIHLVIYTCGIIETIVVYVRGYRTETQVLKLNE